MRQYLIILLLGALTLLNVSFIFVSPTSYTHYYVSSTGSDLNDGLSSSTPWQNISKINGFAFSDYDTISFKKGDTIYADAKLTIPHSNLVFNSYGTGIKPVISGLGNVGAFTDLGGNIWRADNTNTVLFQNTVRINGALREMARYPNSTYLTTTGTTTLTSIPTGLSGTPNYTGASLAILVNRWEFDRSIVSSQSGGTLNLSVALERTNTAGQQFFLQNLPQFLDVQNEWADSSGKLYIYSTTSPSVKVSRLDTMVYALNKSNITFNGIAFTGGNMNGIRMDTCSNVTIQNCVFSDMGANAVAGRSATNFSILSDSFENCLNDGMFFGQDANTNIIVSDSYFKNIGKFKGMMATKAVGSVGTGAGVSMFINGSTLAIERNRIDSIGYSGMVTSCNNSLIKNNYVTTFCLNKDDGGGIYNAYNYGGNNIIRSNIVINGVGIGWFASNIYTDESAYLNLIDSNTCYGGKAGVILLHVSSYITFVDNTVVSDLNGVSLAMDGGSNYNIQRNIFYQTNQFNRVVRVISNPTSSLLDNNYYIYQNHPDPFTISSTNYSFQSWKSIYSASSWDVNSSTVPWRISGAFTLHYNPTNADSVISFAGTKSDPRGQLYSQPITLKPYKSILLANSTRLPYQIGIGGLIFY